MMMMAMLLMILNRPLTVVQEETVTVSTSSELFHKSKLLPHSDFDMSLWPCLLVNVELNVAEE